MNSFSRTAVIGAGPVGCVAAMSLARAGNPVTVFEADAVVRNRFAGEWLHPAGLRALRKTGILEDNEVKFAGMEHKGFVIFPDDGTEPVLLDYPEDQRGLVCEHSVLVDALRDRAMREPGVEFISGARVGSVEKGRLEYKRKGEETATSYEASQIVGADGRGSLVRPALGLPRSSKLISYMVGTFLRDVELPYEGYGHVILGAPGPILLYRVSPDVVRASIDVPIEMGAGASNWGKVLASEYTEYFPDFLCPAFEKTLENEPLQFRANRYRPRLEYGDASLSLVGDAVGFQHPLTAMGMTLGFQDAEGLARFDSFADFRRERRSLTLVPEMLAMTLYQAFSGRDPGACEVRKAIYSMWRSYPKERERTMRLLSGEITSPFRFSISFLRGIQLAVASSVDSDNYRLQWGQLSQTLGSIGQLLQEAVICSSARLGRSIPPVLASRAS